MLMILFRRGRDRDHGRHGLSYEAQRALVTVGDPAGRRKLVRATDTCPEMLYYTLSLWQPEKTLAIRSWIGSSLAMLRGGFLSAKERTALQAGDAASE